MPIDPVALAQELIEIPSITGDEYRVAQHLAAVLAKSGFRVELDDAAPQRPNLFATASKHPRVVFCSHLDTVPPYVGFSEDPEFIYGRGACDAKGIIAAMIAAGELLRSRNVVDFAFLFVVAEETDSVGAKHANQRYADLGSHFVIVGEPTESQFVRATKGAATAKVRFHGLAAHSAYPERGDSAIRKLVRAISLIEEQNWGSDPSLGRATANVGVVRGGEKPNIVPAWAELEMIFRTVTPYQPVLDRLAALVAPLDGTVVSSHGNSPVIMHVPEGKTSTVAGFNTDAPHVANLGRPILFGPGSILDAHTDHERIRKSDLRDAVHVYANLVAELLEGER